MPKIVDKMDNRIVFLCKSSDKERYEAMCSAIGENPSEHLRDKTIAEVELWEASKGKPSP